ncbi:MAG: isochorismatase family protein [Gammaproteobacteria bacterium]|nr:isochorismatase family protein [Gammaproteobacteria bacterium]
MHHDLISVDESVLVIVDVQTHFLDKYEQQAATQLLKRVCWLQDVANAMGVPAVAMAEDIQECASLHPAVVERLPENTRIFDKNYFGLAGHPEILAAINQTSRNTAIVLGAETDVCVAQSALGLLQHGYRVVIPRDLVITTQGDQDTGLQRMQQAGAVISSTKALFYEWLRSVDNAKKLERSLDLDKHLPAGLVL